jgi:hypothetical protein
MTGCGSFYHKDPSSECCIRDCTPILVDLSGNGFLLTSRVDGVTFDIHNNGKPENVAWTAAGAANAWLVLDRDGNGMINSGSELLGDVTPQPVSATPNGFLALAEFDKPEQGGNADGAISASDSIFERLRLWTETNHNGISEPGELVSLPAAGIVSLELNYQEKKWVDVYGNVFRYRAKLKIASGGETDHWAYDVILTSK